MTRLVPDKRCEICGGLLAPPHVLNLPDDRQPDHPPDVADADYVCIECQRPYYWRENPPRLVMGL